MGYSSVAGAVINAGINILFVSYIGLYAASISTAVSFMVIAVYRAIDLKKVISIEYNWRELIVGFFAFIVSSVCLFSNKGVLLGCCWGIAIVYNLTQNRDILNKMIHKFKK